MTSPKKPPIMQELGIESEQIFPPDIPPDISEYQPPDAHDWVEEDNWDEDYR